MGKLSFGTTGESIVYIVYSYQVRIVDLFKYNSMAVLCSYLTDHVDLHRY